jgi:hypothetical protein
MLKLGSNQEFLSNEQINEICPSVFTSKPSTTVSEKYTHIPTSRVIEDMRSLGWDVVDAKQVQSRKEKTNGVGKHLVIFRNDDVVVSGSDGDTVYPQILLTNSHDGKNAFQFQAGLFRLVCENGLVISTQDFEKVKIRHMGYTFEELQTQIRAMVERLPLTVESMNKMKQIELNEEQMVEFATRALQTRFDEKQMKRIAIDINQLIGSRPKRRQGNDVWVVFNRIQEKLIEWWIRLHKEVKSRKARRIKNFQQDARVNSELFDLSIRVC